MLTNKIHLHDSCFPPSKGYFKAKYIILHDIKFDINHTTNLFREHKLSSHYYVSSDGIVYEFANNKPAYHAGISAFKDDKELNSNSIGIETQSSWEYDIPTVQYQALSRLIKKIMVDYNIGLKHILSHAEIAPYRLAEDGSFTYGKSDPGMNFPWRKLSQEGIGMYHDVKINPAPKVKLCFADEDLIDSELQGVHDVQLALYNFGYVLTPINGIYDLQTAAVLNAFYLRYYPEWFTINQENIRSSIIKALKENRIENVKSDAQNQHAISFKELESGNINDKWLFEHIYHLPSSNIDENTLQIINRLLA